MPHILDVSIRAPVVVDLGHITSECEINWARPDTAYGLIVHRCLQLLDHVRGVLKLSPRSLSLHLSRPLDRVSLQQVSSDGKKAGIDVERELSRQRGAYILVRRLKKLNLSVPTSLTLGPSYYQGLGIHPARGARLSYVTDKGGKRVEPIVSQQSVDMQLTLDLLQRTILPVRRVLGRALPRHAVLMSVDDDLVPVVELLEQSDVRCHLVHYEAAIVSSRMRQVASSVTSLPGWRRPIPPTNGRNDASVLSRVVL